MTGKFSKTLRGSTATGFALATLLILAAASAALAVVGALNFSKSSAPIATLRTPLATVEQGTVVDALEGKFQVDADHEWVVSAPAGLGAGLVTRPGASAGTAINDGDVVGTVNERPIVVVASAVPFYRALTVGDEGRDVGELQHLLSRLKYSLGRDRDSTFGSGTARAVFAFYRDRGYAPVDSSGQLVAASAAITAAVPQGELVAVTAVPVVAKTACGLVGDLVAGSICTLSSESTRTVITFTDPSSSSALKPGMIVHLAFGDGTRDGTLGDRQQASPSPAATDAAGAGTPADSTQSVDSTVFNVILDQPLPLSSSGIGSVTLKSSSAEALRVPEIAVHSGSGGKLWLVSRTGATIPVTVPVCAQGYCAIEGSVSVGLKIRLPAVASENG